MNNFLIDKNTIKSFVALESDRQALFELLNPILCLVNYASENFNCAPHVEANIEVAEIQYYDKDKVVEDKKSEGLLRAEATYQTVSSKQKSHSKIFDQNSPKDSYYIK